MKRPASGSDDFQSPSISVPSRSELQGKPGIVLLKRADGYCLAVIRVWPPDEADIDFGSGIARKENPPGVLPVLTQSQACLLDAVRRRALELDERSVFADVRILGVHHHELIGTHGPPPAEISLRVLGIQLLA